MPIKTGQPFRKETITVSTGGSMEVFFYYDQNEDEWLSTHIDTFHFGRNSNAYIGFLRSINGVVTTSTFGPIIAADAKLLFATANSNAVGVINRSVHVFQGGVDLASFSWSGVDEVYVFDPGVNFAGEDNVSVEIQSDGAGASPNRPIVTVGFRWRLT